MPTASFTKFHQFVEDRAHGIHDLSSDTLKWALTNTAPNVSTDEVLADITQITAQNGYSAGGAQATISSSGQTGGTYKLVIADTVFTASGGSFGPFRYAVLYNDTPTSPADPLIGYLDYGSSISVNAGETFTVDADATNGIFQDS
jgi:hypothetical protein